MNKNQFKLCFKKLVCILAFILFFYLKLNAQEELNPEILKQDPKALFSWQLFDEEVAFYLQGSWLATTSLTTGFQINDQGAFIFPQYFPAFGTGFYFNQIPQLNFSIWFAERFFLDLNLGKEWQANTFKMGYLGRENEFIQSVLIGNKDIEIKEYSFLKTPTQSQSSIGLSANLASPFSQHNLLLRFENTQEEKKIFFGQNLVSEKTISPDKYLRGRFFMLPDSEVESLTVYLEDKQGNFTGSDGRRYRKAFLEEVKIDSQNGFIFILKAQKGRIAVHYRKDLFTVGDPELGAGALPPVSGGYLDPSGVGTKFDWNQSWLGENMLERRLIINSQTCLLLWEPAKFSPFEMLSAYDLGQNAPQDISEVVFRLTPCGAGETIYESLPYPLYFRCEPGGSYFLVYYDNNSRTNFYNHYPFPDPLHQVYGPQRNYLPAFFDYEIRVQILVSAAEFRLPENTLSGSIRIRRNGIEETRFRYDEASHTIYFETPIYSFDYIEVFYRTGQSEKNSGDLLFIWGNHFPFNDLFCLNLALGLRWNILPGAFSERSYEKTGAVLLAADLKGETKNLNYKVSLAASLSNPDTTGVLRIEGMDKNSFQIEPLEDLAVPASVPLNLGSLNQTNRGRLFYKDFRFYDAFGGYELMSANWTPPASQIWEYADGSKIGPYQVAGGFDSSRAKSLLLDFELDPNEWVGFQLPFNYKNEAADLSVLKSFKTALKAFDLEMDESFEVFLELGSIGEDLDGDNLLDEEASIYSSGFIFADQANSVFLKVGGGPKNEGNALINSEDFDGNKNLDLEETALVYTSTPLSFSNNTDWLPFEGFFSSIDQEKLKKVRAIRLIVINTSSNQTKARLQVDAIKLFGTSFWSRLTDSTVSGQVFVREIDEKTALIPKLVDSFPELKEQVKAQNTEQKVLHVSWQNLVGSNPGWEIKRSYSEGFECQAYKELVLYIFKDTNFSSGQFSLSFLDHQAKGIKLSFSAGFITSQLWHKLKIDLQEKKVFLNEIELTPDVLEIDPIYSNLSLLSFSVQNSNNGNLFIDEISMHKPQTALGFALKTHFSYVWPETILTIANFPLLANLEFNQDLSVYLNGFSSLYARPQTADSLASKTNFKIDFVGLNLDLTFSALAMNDDWSYSGGHKLTIPAFDFPLVFQDSFNQSEDGAGLYLEHKSLLKFDLPSDFKFQLIQESLAKENLLKQLWKIQLEVFFLNPYKLNLSAELKMASLNFSYNEKDYFTNWFSSYELVWPWEEGNPLSRGFSWKFGQELATQPLGFALFFSSGFNSFDFQYLKPKHKDLLNLEIKLPFQIKDFRLEMSYRRKSEGEVILPFATNLGFEFEKHFGAYLQNDFLFYSLPFYEFFAKDQDLKILAKAVYYQNLNYKPEVELSFSRPVGQKLLDFFLPVKIYFILQRSFSLVDNELDSFLKLESSVLFNSLNIFGKNSSQPVFEWYAIDSFSTNFKTVFNWFEDGNLKDFTFSVESIYTFEVVKSFKLLLRNHFSLINNLAVNLEVKDLGAIEFNWEIRPPAGVSLPLLDEKIIKTGYLNNKETLEIEIKKKSTSEETNCFFQLKHETAVKYENYGYLRGEIALGFANFATVEASLARNYQLYGIKLTLELCLNF